MYIHKMAHTIIKFLRLYIYYFFSLYYKLIVGLIMTRIGGKPMLFFEFHLSIFKKIEKKRFTVL